MFTTMTFHLLSTLLPSSFLAASSSPTESTQVEDTVQTAVEEATHWWDWLMGTPLRILIIIFVASVLTVAVRILIRNFSRKIADGTTAAIKRRDKSGKTTSARPDLLKSDPIAIARRAQRATTVGSLLSSIATALIAVIAVLMIMQELGYNPAPILASAGVAGVAIGFGAQSLVKDYLSGFFIVVEDQYGIGDTVDLGEAIGTVEEVGLRTTKVRGVDGTLWHVRNGEILRVGNQSQGWARAVLDIPVPYDAQQETIDAVIDATIEKLRANPDCGSKILEAPEVWGVQDISGAAVTVRVVIKTEPNEQWAVARAFRAEIKRQLDRRGITLAVPDASMLKTFPDPRTANESQDIDAAENAASTDEAKS